MYKLVLASSSRNRKAILESLCIPFDVDFPTCDEDSITDDLALILTQKRAKAKAESLVGKYKNQEVILVGCDTVIECEGIVFGKPKTEDEARAMFRDDDELDANIKSEVWKGVSSGYRGQGLASRFIKRIEGSPSGIVGLPVYELFSMLKKFTKGIDIS